VDLRDYLRLLRRGWPTLALVLVVSVGLAAAYLLVATKRYVATASVVVTVADARNVSDVVGGAQSASFIASTWAGIIDSETVLGPVARGLDPQISVSQALGAVAAGPRGATGIIDITASGSDPRLVAQLANETARRAITVIPQLQGRSASDTPIGLRTIQTADQPTTAVSPEQRQVLVLGLIAGLVLGLAITIATQTLSTRIQRAEDAQRISGRPVLASLPRLPRPQRQPDVIAENPSGTAGEAYRSLRTNLSFLDFEDRRSLLIVPAASDRDSAQVPVNLAWSLAQAGRTVLLIDADLRSAPIARMLEVEPSPGLSELLLSPRLPIEEGIRATRYDRLRIVPAGDPTSNPSDLLSLPRLGQLLLRWEKEFDYVLVNAPSMLSYTDAAVLARETAGTVVEVALGRTRAMELEGAIGALGNVRVEPLGLVVTGTRRTARDNRRIRRGSFDHGGRWSLRRSTFQSAPTPVSAADAGQTESTPQVQP
jgi:capsular exopolysaccharide synthesis family protein